MKRVVQLLICLPFSPRIRFRSFPFKKCDNIISHTFKLPDTISLKELEMKLLSETKIIMRNHLISGKTNLILFQMLLSLLGGKMLIIN